jgi:serine/threonine-protein kinase
VEVGGERWFVKTARSRMAAESLARAVRFHAAVRHPAIVPLRHWLRAEDRLTLVYPWTEGEVLYPATVPRTHRRSDPGSPMRRFRHLPVERAEAAVDRIIDAHLAVEDAGFVAVDFYDGCILYDFDAHAVRLCDLDEYRPGPFTVAADRLPGSTRYMAPEEWRRGATIDCRTTVFNLGRTARLLLDGGDLEVDWRGSQAQLDVVAHATDPDPQRRYATVRELADAWRSAGAGVP